MESPLEAVAASLAGVGLYVTPEWLQDSVDSLPAHQHPGQTAIQVVQSILNVDIRRYAMGRLPVIDDHAVEKREHVMLPGPYFLQIDEAVNMGASADDRNNDVGGPLGRLLKLALSDGQQQVYGIEHAHLREISTKSHAGLKMVVRNVEMRRGLLLLRPDNVKVLGGKVDNLVAMQQAVYGAGAGSSGRAPTGVGQAGAAPAAAGHPPSDSMQAAAHMGSSHAYEAAAAAPAADGDALPSPGVARPGNLSRTQPLQTPSTGHKEADATSGADYGMHGAGVTANITPVLQSHGGSGSPWGSQPPAGDAGAGAGASAHGGAGAVSASATSMTSSKSFVGGRRSTGGAGAGSSSAPPLASPNYQSPQLQVPPEALDDDDEVVGVDEDSPVRPDGLGEAGASDGAGASNTGVGRYGGNAPLSATRPKAASTAGVGMDDGDGGGAATRQPRSAAAGPSAGARAGTSNAANSGGLMDIEDYGSGAGAAGAGLTLASMTRPQGPTAGGGSALPWRATGAADTAAGGSSARGTAAAAAAPGASASFHGPPHGQVGPSGGGPGGHEPNPSPIALPGDASANVIDLSQSPLSRGQYGMTRAGQPQQGAVQQAGASSGAGAGVATSQHGHGQGSTGPGASSLAPMAAEAEAGPTFPVGNIDDDDDEFIEVPDSPEPRHKAKVTGQAQGQAAVQGASGAAQTHAGNNTGGTGTLAELQRLAQSTSGSSLQASRVLVLPGSQARLGHLSGFGHQAQAQASGQGTATAATGSAAPVSVYSLRCFICEPDHAAALEARRTSDDDGAGLGPVTDSQVDGSAGVWAELAPNLIQQLLPITPAEMTARRANKKGDKAGWAAVVDMVTEMEDKLYSYSGRLRLLVRSGSVTGGPASQQGAAVAVAVTVTELPDLGL